jgi:hypothetical protein
MTFRETIHHYIRSHRDDHIEKLREYLRQPGISAENLGIRESAELLMRFYRDLGCQEVELVETDGHPGVWAVLDVGAPKTLVNYCMYDVQPVAGQPWTHDPFAADLVPQPPFPRVVIARGAYNSRGPYRFWLNALESVLAVTGTLPVNLMFIAERWVERANVAGWLTILLAVLWILAVNFGIPPLPVEGERIFPQLSLAILGWLLIYQYRAPEEIRRYTA